MANPSAPRRRQPRSGGGQQRGTGGSASSPKSKGGTPQGTQRGANRSGKRRDGIDETVAQLAGPLQRVLARLPETQRRVLELRMGLVDGHPHDLADTARTLSLSLSEAREIEERAFAHIREVVPLAQLQRFLDR
ncbi:MAG: sigma factor-like helix-turn-helix DNA-binding protein [Nitriliruptoraceae bacterium]